MADRVFVPPVVSDGEGLLQPFTESQDDVWEKG